MEREQLGAPHIDTQPLVFSGDAQGRRPPPSPKGWLFALNRQMDWLIDRVQEAERAELSLRRTSEFTHVERAIIALEDRRFYAHSGIDWMFIPRVFRQVATLKRPGGVSTIEQQLVRTLIERRERTISRKSRELLLAWILAHRASKRDIIHAYLAYAYMGYRLRGLDAPSRAVFGLDAIELHEEEATLVASLLVYPIPKSVIQGCGGFPYDSYAGFLSDAKRFSPRWARKVQRRINYGLAIAPKIKQPR